MTVTLSPSTTVLVLWWIALGLTVLIIVPLAIYLLHRLWRAARNIQLYSAAALEAGVGIAGNTALIPALDDTIAGAGPLLARASAIHDLTATVARVLRQRAGKEV
ncbi:MAG: hypothetical protein ACR2GQ_10825 [Gemmatimonadota bacterium]|jgi:hypothetical protein